ncbi:MAG: anaerobic ribonucleoside-triphosphate reductase activating protein [Bacteroidales bacterium]
MMTQVSGLSFGGWQKQSFVDWPGQLSTVLFTPGCNLRCPYCHNATLLRGENLSVYPSEQVLSWLALNRQLLDAVVVSGGEPTLHKGLLPFFRNVKELGLKNKLDTNGTHPALLQQLIEQRLLDFVAMDIKAPLQLKAYKKVVGPKFSASMMEQVKQSVALLKASPIKVAFRITVARPLLNPQDVLLIKNELEASLKVQNYQCSEGVLAPVGLTPWTPEELAQVLAFTEK